MTSAYSLVLSNLVAFATRLQNRSYFGLETTPLPDTGMSSLQVSRFCHFVQAVWPGLDTVALQACTTLAEIAELVSRTANISSSISSPLVCLNTFFKPKIAIVSASCRLPEDCNNPSTFWQFLVSKRNAITSIPLSRWDVNSAYPEGLRGHPALQQGSFVNDVHMFDNAMFGMSPSECGATDPQQRLILEVGVEALLRSRVGLSKPSKPIETSAPESDSKSPTLASLLQRFRGESVGVFVGMANLDWSYILAENQNSSYAYAGQANGSLIYFLCVTQSIVGIAAGRLSYTLGLTGPSMIINTTCSSSLVAIDAAISALEKGTLTAAVVIACSLNLHPQTSVQLHEASQLSKLGRCASFDASADGYVRGEGCIAIVLRTLDIARAEKDNILGLVRGCVVNSDGALRYRLQLN